jgi:hypothetical protein
MLKSYKHLAMAWGHRQSDAETIDNISRGDPAANYSTWWGFFRHGYFVGIIHSPLKKEDRVIPG